MDQAYTDLLRYQVELEEKNSALEESQKFIDNVLGSMSDVMIVCDNKGKSLTNVTLISRFGYPDALSTRVAVCRLR